MTSIYFAQKCCFAHIHLISSLIVIFQTNMTERGGAMSQDGRVRYTKMAIHNSFMELIKRKPFSQITLKEVCALAEVNHSTFYRHYKDIFDWKEQLEASIMEHLENFLHDFDSSDMKSILLSQLQYYQCNKELFTVISSEHFESSLMEKLCAKMLEHAEMETCRIFPDNPDAGLRWDCWFIICGIVGVIRCWTFAGMAEPPEDVATYITEHITPYFSSELRKRGEPH